VSGEQFPADPSLPQLEVATDPERMREIFQEHLRSLDGKAYRVLECRISFLRQTTSRCLLHYSLRLGDPGTGQQWSQLVTGVIYGGNRTQRTWQRLRRSEPPEQAIPSSPSSVAFAPFCYLPELDMLVQVFPYDHRLPALRQLLMWGPTPELEALLVAGLGEGGWHLEGWEVEPVRYRVDMRATLRLTLGARQETEEEAGGSGRVEQRRFYAKVYRKEEEGEQTYQVLRQLWEASGEGFSVARPIAYLGSLHLLLQEEVPGISLRDILVPVKSGATEEQEVTPVVRKVARALAALHLSNVVTPRQRRLRDEVARLERAGKDLRSACPHLGVEIEGIIGAVVAGLQEVPPAPIHGDLKPWDILFDGDRLVLLDLDKFAGGDPLLDVANFLVNLAKTGPPSSLSHVRPWGVEQTFAEEYFAHAPEEWRARLPLHYAMAVLKRAAGLYRSKVLSWRDKIEALITEAGDSLAGRIW
jgi:aminoglycoside phosphotransferase (APT) family kinase protein